MAKQWAGLLLLTEGGAGEASIGERCRSETTVADLVSVPTTVADSTPLLLAPQVEVLFMGAKFSVLPQRNGTDAQMSERGILAVYSERLVTIGCQLRGRRRLRAERAVKNGVATCQSSSIVFFRRWPVGNLALLAAS